MLDRLTGMQVFARVAALGGISPAARALGMSPTMATKHLAALEERLGVRLLHRTTRRLTLTEAGRGYLEGAERILAEVEDVEALAAAERVEVRGTLRVNVPVSFGFRRVAPLLAEFARLHPALVIDLGLNDRVVDLVEEGWDLAVRIGALASSSLVARRLAPCRMAVCASPAYLAAHGQPTRIAELSTHDCLGYTLSRAVGPESWKFGKAGTASVPIRGSLRANNGDALMQACLAGLGIIYQPSFLVAEEVRAGRLVTLELDHPPLELDGIYAIYPAQARLPAKQRAFLDFLARKFAGEPAWDCGTTSRMRRVD